jgi:hypothetical protein
MILNWKVNWRVVSAEASMFTKICPNPECPDIELFGVQGAYGGEVERCAKCGTSLVPKSEVAARQDSLHLDYPKLVPLCSPRTSSEIAVITSLLRAEGIYFFIHNEFFGRMHVGPTIPLVNQRTILVAEEDYDRALEVVTLQEGFEPEPPYRLGILDRIRMVLEALLFGWVLPGRRRWHDD